MGSQIIVDLSPLAPTKTTKTFRMYSSTYERISKLAERTGLTIGDLLERMTKTFEDILENKDEYNISIVKKATSSAVEGQQPLIPEEEL